jgi:hypothetical protein
MACCCNVKRPRNGPSSDMMPGSIPPRHIRCRRVTAWAARANYCERVRRLATGRDGASPAGRGATCSVPRGGGEREPTAGGLRLTADRVQVQSQSETEPGLGDGPSATAWAR